MEKILAILIVYILNVLSIAIVAFLYRKIFSSKWVLTVLFDDGRKECYKYSSKEMAERAEENIIRSCGCHCWTNIIRR